MSLVAVGISDIRFFRKWIFDAAANAKLWRETLAPNARFLCWMLMVAHVLKNASIANFKTFCILERNRSEVLVVVLH